MIAIYCEIIQSMVVFSGKNRTDHEIVPLKTFVGLAKPLEDYLMGDYDLYRCLHGG